MTTEVRIYVEGGGDGRESKAAVRRGFGTFLIQLRDAARDRRIRWQIVACGPRNATLDNFRTAQRTHPDAFNVLLVDAEGPVVCSPSEHLRQRDGWNMPALPDDHFLLMVQMMEAWLIADPDALAVYYGQGFNKGAIPRNPNVEQVDKTSIEAGLQAATRRTRKGEYHKIRHGPTLLERIDPGKVRAASQHCERLFTLLAEKMSATL